MEILKEMCNCRCHNSHKKSKKNKYKCECECECDICPPCPPVPRQTFLLVTVTPNPLVVTLGNIITVSVTVTNVGNFPAVDTRLLVQLPASNIFNWQTSSVSCQPLATMNTLSFRCPAGTIFPGSSKIAIFQATVPSVASQISYQIVASAVADNANQVSAVNSFTVSSTIIPLASANLLSINGNVIGNPTAALGPFVGSGLSGLTGGPLVI